VRGQKLENARHACMSRVFSCMSRVFKRMSRVFSCMSRVFSFFFLKKTTVFFAPLALKIYSFSFSPFSAPASDALPVIFSAGL
jgi:hypothetical protein